MGFAWQATVGGELPLGKSEFLIFLDIYSCFHILKYEIHMDTTSQGPVEKSLKK